MKFLKHIRSNLSNYLKTNCLNTGKIEDVNDNLINSTQPKILIFDFLFF